MYVYSTLNHRKIFHTQHCRYIRNCDSKNLSFFSTKEEGFAAGYRTCKCCTKLAKIYQKQKSNVLRFCEEKNYKLIFINDVIDIATPFSKWKIHSTKKGRKLKLFHENSVYTVNNKMEFFNGYHTQGVFDTDLIKVLEYIYNHDKYRIDNPFESTVFSTKKRINKNRKSKAKISRQRKSDKKRQKRKRVDLVYAIMDKLEEKK